MGCGCGKGGNRRKQATSSEAVKTQIRKSARQSIRELWNKSSETKQKTTVKKINKLPTKK